MKLLIILLITSSVLSSNYFIHLSDIHLDLFYQQGAPNNCLFRDKGLTCCRNNSIPEYPYSPANVWGDYACDSPLLLVENIINWIGNNLEFDFVLYTGDSFSHNIFNQSWANAYSSIKTVTLLLQALKKPVYFVLGNHDTAVIDQLSQLSPVVTDTAKLWEYSGFENGGYYTENIPLGNLSLCGLNSLWYDKNNVAVITSPTTDFFGQYNWSATHLDNCILISHIFPTASESDTMFNQFILTVNPLYEFYGHTHSDIFVIINGTKSLRVGWMPSSIMPNDHYPSFRRYIYTPKNFTILDYEQYVHNLTAQWNSTSFIGMDLAYTALSEYDLPDMSAISWWKMAQKMVYNTTLFNRYCYNLNYPSYNCDKSILCDINQALC